jgi:hypothetical protein
MKVQIHDTKQALRVLDLPELLTIEQATALIGDLVDAVTQCGFEVKLTVDVPRHVPTDAQVSAAVRRVAHIRKTLEPAAWNDERLNRELVVRVLEQCL